MPFANVHTDGLEREGTPRHVNYIHTLGHPQKSAKAWVVYVNVVHFLKWPRSGGYPLQAEKAPCVVNYIHNAWGPQKHTDGLEREGTPRHVNYVHTPQTAYGNRWNPGEGWVFLVNVFHAFKWPA